MTDTAALPPQQLANSAPRRRQVISLTPLIDVVFILLVFFMLAFNLQRFRALDLGAPADTVGQQASDSRIVIDVYDTEVGVGAMRMDLDSALAELAPNQTGADAPHILLRPAPGVTLQRVVTVLDAMTGISSADVALVNTLGE